MKIVIDGEPISQIRMKFTNRGGLGRLYDPCASQKNAIKKIVADKARGIEKFLHPRISFLFLMPIPKSITKKKRQRLQTNLIKHEKKPDVDNFIKFYLDCLDTYVFDGDEKVQLGPCFKIYHSHPQTVILITEASEALAPHEIDQALFFYLTSKESDISSFSETAYPCDS